MFNRYYSPYQFSLFRILLGFYLFIHFVYLIPYASEIWSSNGILPEASLNLTYGFFPNLLNSLDSPIFVTVFVSTLALLSLLFCFGLQRNFLAIILWYGWACLFNRNNLISNPGIPFIGWLLLVSALIPRGEPWSLSNYKNENWNLPKPLIIGAWLIMSISYSISGFDKLISSSWADGTAIHHLLSNPLARNTGLRELLLSLPLSIIQLMTWSILAIEVLFLPLALFRTTRKWIWFAMLLMHLGILILVDFADLTFGVLMIQFFTFDSEWIKARKLENSPIVFFDGVCGLCNSFVNILLSEDRNQVLKFSPLQGQTAKAKLPKDLSADLKTMAFFRNDRLYTKSDAALEVLKTIGGIFSLFYIFKFIPRFIRDAAYDFISKNRIRWFGQSESCRMPTKEERVLFLD